MPTAVRIILVGYELALFGIPALLAVLATIYICTIIPVLRLEPPWAKWLYRFILSPVRDEFSDTQNVWWPLYPPAFYPPVLREMFPDSIHNQVRAYMFKVSIAPYSQIVVDVVPITDAALELGPNIDDVITEIGDIVEFGGID
ncbi:MAG: hypothetical protein FWG89_00525 [Treponema sp.]|nr:hypothetical protein [Treponema sp.]